MNTATTTESLGFPKSITQEQREIILKPFVTMDDFTGGGALNMRRAIKYWAGCLKGVGASSFVIDKAKAAWEGLKS